MILFVDKQTQKIIGKIDGRVHPDSHLKMWIGDKNTTERIIVPWKAVVDGEEEVEQEILQEVGKDMDGQSLYRKVKVKKKIQKKHWEPDSEQKELIFDIERQKKNLKDFKVDLKTKQLVPIKAK